MRQPVPDETPRSLSLRELLEQVGERLELRWAGGQAGIDRQLESSPRRKSRPALVGYLNLIYPNQVQIIGTEEIMFLDSLEPRQRAETIARIVEQKPAALIATRNQKLPDDLALAVETSGTPSLTSSASGRELETYLHYHLARLLARRTTLHGVFVEVYSIGVLITGPSAAGKSELALDLVTRGHRLIADDAPEFTLIAPDVIDGTCPEMLQDLLEVRGLGILNIRELFGHTAVKRNKYLRLIVELGPIDALENIDPMCRLKGIHDEQPLLGVSIPRVVIPVAPGRNLAVLLETAVRHHLLLGSGSDPATAFLNRQASQLRRQMGTA